MKCKFNVGDKVKIMNGRYVEDYMGGWNADMDRMVGEIRTIEYADVDKIQTEEGVLYRPFYMLEDSIYTWDERALVLVDSVTTKDVVIKTRFLFDEADDEDLIMLTVPKKISNDQIKKELNKTSEELFKSDEYGELGCNYETLLSAVCKKNDWMYRKIVPEVEITV